MFKKIKKPEFFLKFTNNFYVILYASLSQSSGARQKKSSQDLKVGERGKVKKAEFFFFKKKESRCGRTLKVGHNWGRMDLCTCMAESLHCSPETITTLLIGYTPVPNKKVFLGSYLKSTPPFFQGQLSETLFLLLTSINFLPGVSDSWCEG